MVMAYVNPPDHTNTVPYVTDPKTSDVGLRYDAGKSPYHLWPTDAQRKVVDHFGIGARKYAERNWEKGMAYSKVYNSLNRHLAAWWEGEDVDAETGSLHITAVAWNAIALLTYIIRGIGTDDRPGKVK